MNSCSQAHEKQQPTAQNKTYVSKDLKKETGRLYSCDYLECDRTISASEDLLAFALFLEKQVYCNQNKTIFKHKCRKIAKFVEKNFDVKKVLKEMKRFNESAKSSKT